MIRWILGRLLQAAATLVVVIPLLIPRTRRWVFAVLRAREPRQPD